MSNFKIVAAFAGGLILGAGFLSISPPESGAQPGMPVMMDAGTNPEGMLPPEGAELPPPPEGEFILPPDQIGKPLEELLPAGQMPELAPEQVVPGPEGIEGAPTPPVGITSAGKQPKPMAGVVLLDEHLADAEARLFALRGRARASEQRVELLAEIDLLVTMVPKKDQHMPPLQQVVSYLVRERMLVDRMAELGLDVTEADEALNMLLSPPQAKVVGGHNKALHQGGGGQARDGSRPLDPDVPRRIEDDG